ncbi:MAG: sensor histidine kinase, partial [Ktedonobacteraceae bacterium]|nr:sensor histidine kinase [Ktedonobacteraceae bacterium]
TRSVSAVSWLISRAAELAVVLSLFLGYLGGVLGAEHLTLLNFLAFTVVHILYGVVFWWILAGASEKHWQCLLWTLALMILTCASGLLALTGLWFNWLLYFVTAAVYFTYLPLRNAFFAFVLLYIVIAFNSYLLDADKFQVVRVEWFTLLAGFIFVAAFSLSNRLLRIERERSRQLFRQLETSKQELEQAHEQLQVYANEVEELAIARERTRVAREIHDTLGHYLTITSIQLETIGKLLERDPMQAMREVEEARKVAAQSMQEVRNAVRALRPTDIARLQLVEALTQLGTDFRQVASGVELALDLETTLPPLAMEVRHALYRAAQEALTNVRKHANATKVLVRLRYEQETLELLIRDNGEGSDQKRKEQPEGGFGLVGLRERVELLGGQVSFGPGEPSGYRVLVRIHCPQGALEQPLTDRLVAEQGSGLL